MAGILLNISKETLTLIDNYQDTYRILHNKKIGRATVVDKVFDEFEEGIKEMTAELEQLIEQREASQ